MGIDVVSGGELYTAIKADFPMDKVYFHGNNKTADEIELAVKNKVGNIIVDNIYELEALNETAKKYGVVQNIMFRSNPVLTLILTALFKQVKLIQSSVLHLKTAKHLKLLKSK